MAGNIKGITIEIDGNTTKLTKSLQGVNKNLKNTQSALRDVDRLLKLDPASTTLLKQKQDLLKSAISDTQEKLKQEKEALKQLQANNTTGEVTEDQQALEREIAATEQSLASLTKELKEFGTVASQKMKVAGAAMREVGAGVTEAGRDLTKSVTTPIVGMGAAAVAAFKSVDDGADIIVKKTGASGDALDEMKASMESLATTIPTDFETAGAAIGEVNTRFGLTGKELEDLSGQFIKFADLNDTDVSSSIDSVQKVMGLFGIETQDAGLVLDTFNAVGQRTGLSVTTLASSMVTNGAAMKDMGFSASDAANFLGDVEVAGVDSNAVMKALKTSYKKASKEGKNFGKTLSTMQESIKGAETDEEAAKIATEAFGAAAGPQMAAAIREGKLSLDELGTSLTDNVGSVSSTFETTVDPMDQFKTTLNSLKLALASIGTTILTVLQPILLKASEVITSLKEKWDALSPGTQELIVKIGMIAAVVGPVLVVVGKIITVIGTLVVVIGTIIGALNPVTIAIGAAIAIGVALWKNWDKISSFAQNTLVPVISAAWQAIKTTVSTVFNAIKGFWNSTLKPAFTAIKTFITATLKPAFTTAFNGIKTAVKTAFTGIKTVWTSVLKPAFTAIKTAVNTVKTTFSNAFTAMKTKVTTTFNSIKTFISGILEKIKGLFKFSWSLPHLKLPHIKYDLISVPVLGSIPNPTTLRVEWYKKAMQNGMVLDNPTLFGMNNGKLLGAGEAGAEVIVGYHSLQDMIANAAGDSALTGKVDAIIAILSETMPEISADKGVYIDSNKLVGALAPSLNRRLGASMGW